MTLEARSLKRLEAHLVIGLLWQTEHPELVEQVAGSSVVDLGDGRLRFLGMHAGAAQRLVAFAFDDEDGVRVETEVLMDSGGQLFELSVRRTDGAQVRNLRLGILPAHKDFFATVVRSAVAVRAS